MQSRDNRRVGIAHHESTVGNAHPTSEPLRLLAITNLYPRPGNELMAAFNRQQFKALAQQHELRVVAPVPWQQRLLDRARGATAPRHYRNADGIEVDHPTFYYLPRLAPHRYGNAYLRSVRPKVERIVKEFNPDALFACWAHPDGWAAVRLAREMNLPVVIKVIGTDVLVLAREPRRRERIAWVLRNADAVVAVSHDLARHVAHLGVAADRIRVVSEGIDRSVFSPGDKAEARARLGLPGDRPVILFVGNLLVSKGAAVLIEACRLLRDEFCRECPPWHSARNATEGVPNRGRNDAHGERDGLGRPFSRKAAFHCCLVGGGRDEGKLRSLIDDYGLNDFVALAGPCPQSHLPDWYRAADVVSLPSFSEGIPNVLREAMECGTPFVATRVGGIPEISHPSYSRLVEPGDAPALAAALAEMLRMPLVVDPVLVRQHNVSWQQSAAGVAAVLQAAVDGRTSKPITQEVFSA